MTKKVSQITLKEKLSDGWDVDKVDQPKPKKTPKPLLRDVIAEGIAKSSAETQKAVMTMADSINAFVEAQSKAGQAEQTIKVEVPEPKKEKKKTWQFEVQRDRNGFIESIEAIET